MLKVPEIIVKSLEVMSNLKRILPSSCLGTIKVMLENMLRRIFVGFRAHSPYKSSHLEIYLFDKDISFHNRSNRGCAPNFSRNTTRRTSPAPSRALECVRPHTPLPNRALSLCVPPSLATTNVWQSIFSTGSGVVFPYPWP